MSTALAPVNYDDRREEIHRHLCEGATAPELELFIAVCNRTQLDPFARQIFAIKRWDSAKNRKAMAVQVSIDGLRLIAQRSGERDGEDGPYYCGAEGVWLEVWTRPAAELVAAKVTVYRRGQSRGYTGLALWSEYAQTTRDGRVTQMWADKPALMLAKCAESLALRKAFPQELSGLYTGEEMARGPEAEAVPLVVAPAAPPPPAGSADDDDKPPAADPAAWKGAPAAKPEVLALPPGYAEPREALLVKLIAEVAKHHGSTPAKVQSQLLAKIGFKTAKLCDLHPDIIAEACERLRTHLAAETAEPVVAPGGGMFNGTN